MAKTPDDQRLELLQGTLDMLVRRTLQCGPRHGHGIGPAIRAQSDDLLKVQTGSLHPAPPRLVKRGRLKEEWGVSEANQRAKYDHCSWASCSKAPSSSRRGSQRAPRVAMPSALASSYFENMRMPGAASVVGAAAVLGGAAILASLMPAARASRVDVLNALRSESIVSRVNVDDPVIRG